MEQEVGDGWTSGVHPDDLQQCLRTYLDAFGRRQPFEMQYRLRRRDGRYRWIFDRGGPVFDQHGRFRGYVGSCVDVHERVQLGGDVPQRHAINFSTLNSMLPICAWCQRVKTAAGLWYSLELYLRDNSDVQFTHCVCPDCHQRKLD